MTFEYALKKLEVARRKHYRAANPSEATSRRETSPADMDRRQRRVVAALAEVDHWAKVAKSLRPRTPETSTEEV